MPVNPAPNFEEIRTFVSPDVGDILVWEKRHFQNAKHQSPEYGVTKPHDLKKYPDHRLVYIAPPDEEGFERWFFAAPRENQDDYNFTQTFPYSGVREFPRITRTYLELRSEYKPRPKGEADPVHEKAFLIGERQIRTNVQELDSLYVAVERVYDTYPDPTTQDHFNFEISYPHADRVEFPRYTREYVYKRKDYTPRNRKDPDPDPENDGALLIFETTREFNDELLDSIYIQVIRIYDTLPTAADQDEWNAEISYPYGGNESFPRYTRTYLLDRDTYVPLAKGTADSANASAILFSEQTRRTGDQVTDREYIQVIRTFDQPPDISDPADEAKMLNFGYRIEYPNATISSPRITWRIPVLESSYTASPDLDPSPFAAPFDTLVLVDQGFEMPSEQNQYGTDVRIYEEIPGPDVNSDYLSEPNRTIPQKFLSEQIVSEIRTKVAEGTLPPALTGTVTYDPAAAEADRLSIDWDIRSQVQSETNKILALQLVQRNTSKAIPLHSWTVDPETGNPIEVITEIVPHNSQAGTGIDESGNLVEIEAINALWSLKTTRKAIDLAGNDRVYKTTRGGIYWPPVLKEFDITPATSLSGNIAFTVDWTLKDAYTGPTVVQAIDRWSKLPPNIPPLPVMRPTGITFRGQVARFSIPNCLHMGWIVYEFINAYSYTKAFPATNYEEWPETIIVEDSARPYRGGYWRHTEIAFRPTVE